MQTCDTYAKLNMPGYPDKQYTEVMLLLASVSVAFLHEIVTLAISFMFSSTRVRKSNFNNKCEKCFTLYMSTYLSIYLSIFLSIYLCSYLAM